MRYRYLAYSLGQGVVKGRLEARTLEEAHAEVRELGVRPLGVHPYKGMPSLETLFPSVFRVKTGDLVRFARNLGSMLRSGGSLLRAIEMLQDEARSRVMRRTLASIRRTLDEGGSLSDALKRHPDVFSPLFVSIVEVGEYSGQLAPSLEQMADMLERDHEAGRKALQTLMYPAAIVCLSMVTMAVLMTVALPPMLKVFQRMGSDVPLITRLTVGAFTQAQAHIFQLVIGALVLAGLLTLLRRVPRVRYWIDVVQLKVPVTGGVIVASELSRFSRTLSMLLDAGVPLATALRLAIAGCKNRVIKGAFQLSEDSLLSGRGLTTALKRTGVLPSLFVELAMIGEASNSLKKTMKDAAETYQKQLDQRLASLLGLIEPVSTLVVGAIVAIMAFSMLIPIYSGLKSFR